MDTTSSGIVLFSGFEKLKEEIKRLKTELSMLLLERDELELVTCKNIEVAYHLKFGALEYKAYEAQCTALPLLFSLGDSKAKHLPVEQKPFSSA